MNRRWLLLLTLTACPTFGGAQPAPAGVDVPKAAQQGGNRQDALDEVIINARREKLSQLRREIEKAEEHFIAAYNQINTEPQYHISCSREAPTGSWISERACRPAFVDSANARDAQEYKEFMGGLGGGAYAGQAAAVIAEKEPAYLKHMVEAINKNPKLLNQARKIQALRKHYQEARKLKFKGRWIVLD